MNPTISNNEPFIDQTSQAQLHLSTAINQFCNDLFYSLDSASNVISSISIGYALGLLQIATIGKCSRELEMLLGYKFTIDDLKNYYAQLSGSCESTEIRMATILVVNNRFAINNRYVEMVKPLTSIVYGNLDDNQINSSVNEIIGRKTGIDDIAYPISSTTKFAICNALNLKIEWYEGFDPALTQSQPFHRSPADLVKMMRKTSYFQFYENSKVQVINIPLAKTECVFGVILPRKYIEEDDLNYTINNIPVFTTAEIDEFINNMQYTKVELHLPKFTDTKTVDITDLMAKMGYTSFDETCIDMIAPHLTLSSITHTTKITIDETGGPIVKTTDKVTPVKMNCNHTFLYYVRHQIDEMMVLMGDYQG